MEAQGITKPYVAEKLKIILEHGKAREKLEVAKMFLTMTGDIKDEKGTPSITATGPVMVIMGATKERMRALKEGPLAQLPESIDV